jgi:hypothetical protein
MHRYHDIHGAAYRVINRLDDLSVRGCDEFDPAYEEAEREFAELRLEFGRQ